MIEINFNLKTADIIDQIQMVSHRLACDGCKNKWTITAADNGLIEFTFNSNNGEQIVDIYDDRIVVFDEVGAKGTITLDYSGKFSNRLYDLLAK